MSKEKILKLAIDIQVGADMAKNWLNENGVRKDEHIWEKIENILGAAEEIRNEAMKPKKGGSV